MSRFVSPACFILPLTALLGVLALFGARPALAAGVVGTGTPASCTETALNFALAGGGTVTFNCGAAAKTIPITSVKQISDNTTIDGGNKIILSASKTNHFQVL